MFVLTFNKRIIYFIVHIIVLQNAFFQLVLWRDKLNEKNVLAFKPTSPQQNPTNAYLSQIHTHTLTITSARCWNSQAQRTDKTYIILLGDNTASRPYQTYQPALINLPCPSQAE